MLRSWQLSEFSAKMMNLIFFRGTLLYVILIISFSAYGRSVADAFATLACTELGHAS